MKIRIYDAGRHAELQTGYGQMSSNIYEHLKALKQDVAWFQASEAKDKDTVYLWIRPPHYIKYDEFDEKYCNIFYTMHELETFDDWKKDWPILLNCCHGIITPSEWNKEVFVKNGVVKPIDVVPLGIDTKTFYDRYRAFSVLAVHENLGGDASRERWQDTIDAFVGVFSGKHNVRLTIKTWNWKPDGFNKFLKQYDITKLPKIDVTDLKLEPVTMAELYRTHHVFIKNSNGEGWSMPVSEAFSAGCFLLVNDLPLFRERLKEGTESLFFKDKEGLKQALSDSHRDWKKLQGKKEAYSWKNTTKKLLNSINKTYVEYQKAN